MNSEKVHYWTKMKDKAARNLATLSECTEPEDEQEAKDRLGRVLKHKSSCEIADAIFEATEWAIAHLELEKHKCCSEHPVVGVVK